MTEGHTDFALEVLGRGVVIVPGEAPPPPWSGAPVVTIDDGTLAAPAEVVAGLHGAFASRTPVVVVLGPADELRARAENEVFAGEPREVGPDFSFQLERLHHLVWANTYDARSGPPVWWWARKAARIGADEGGPADVVLPDGSPAYIDGGPRGDVPGPARPSLDAFGIDGLSVVHRESVAMGELSVDRYRPPSASLAPDQLSAVSHASGPARVIAPAGSGKTRVLTARLAHLLSDRGYSPGGVTALAYNTRAAAEMRQRLPGVEAPVRTIHSLSWELVREGARREGRAQPRLVEERDVRRMLDTLVDTRPQPGVDSLAPYIEGLSAIRIGFEDPAEAEQARPDAPGLAAVYAAYRDLLAREAVVDFDEQVYGALALLLRNPAFRRDAQRAAQHLLVDEFQDLRPAFLLLIRLLAAPGFSVFAVGDDDQVIYGYDGASPEFLVEFDRYFPGTTAESHHALEVNYRCPEVVTKAAATLLSYNEYRVEKAIAPGPSVTADPGALVVELHPAAEVAPATAARLHRWLADGVNSADIAVLARVNSALMPLQVALSAKAVGHSAPLSPDVLARTGLRTALAYLRLATSAGTYSAADLIATINRPTRGLATFGKERLGARRTWSHSELVALAATLNPRAQAAFSRFLDHLHEIGAMHTAGAECVRLVTYINERVGLVEAMTSLDQSRPEVDRSGHSDDLLALAAVARLHPDPVTFPSWLREQLSVPASPGGVTLSSVHKVKGMEWNHVIVYGTTLGLFPHRLADDVEEERRIFHVALTRARTAAVVAGERLRPSPFLDEMAGKAPRRLPAPSPSATRSPDVATPRERARDRDRARRRRSGASGADDGRLSAELGLEITAKGYEGIVVECNDDGVMLDIGTTRMSIPYGEVVRRRGERYTLVAPAGATELRSAASDLTGQPKAIFDALCAWRAERARSDGVPAFVVAHDAHLVDVARAAPTTLSELESCFGFGPVKVERYGEGILAVIEGTG